MSRACNGVGSEWKRRQAVAAWLKCERRDMGWRPEGTVKEGLWAVGRSSAGGGLKTGRLFESCEMEL